MEKILVSSLGYLHCPECFGVGARKFIDIMNRSRFRKASHIVALSEGIKRDLISHYDIPEEKITVEYPEISSYFNEPLNDEELERLRTRYGIPDRYLLQYGELSKLNNQKMTVEALSNISPDISIVLVGNDKAHYRKELEKIAKLHGVENRIIFIEEIYDDQLATLTQGAEIVLCLAKYEGFPYHLISALTSGCIVIASAIEEHEAAGGPDQYYIDSDDSTELISAIHSLLRDPASAKIMAEAGKEYVNTIENSASKI